MSTELVWLMHIRIKSFRDKIMYVPLGGRLELALIVILLYIYIYYFVIEQRKGEA